MGSKKAEAVEITPVWAWNHTIASYCQRNYI